MAFDDVSLVKSGTSTNLAPNPGFETANSGWTEIPSTVFPATSIWRSGWGMATERTGQYGYAISNVGYGYKWTDPISVTPGDELDVFAWMRGEIDPDDSAGSAGVRAYFYDSSGAYLSWAGVSIYPGSLDGAWELGGKSVTVPSGASTVRMMLISHSNSGWVAFDDAYLSDVSSNTSTTYYDVAGRRVAFRDSDGIQYLFSDHIGSATVSYRPSDGQTERQYYTPYGGIRHTDGLDTDIGYTGQRADTSTGLMFYNARYYDPAIGRFISPDTIVPDPSNPQDYDRYAYVRNNPVNYSDPSGHFARAPLPDELNRELNLIDDELRLVVSHNVIDDQLDRTNLFDPVRVASELSMASVTGCPECFVANRELVDTTFGVIARNPGASAAIGSTAACFLPFVGLVACGALQIGSAVVVGIESIADSQYSAKSWIGAGTQVVVTGGAAYLASKIPLTKPVVALADDLARVVDEVVYYVGRWFARTLIRFPDQFLTYHTLDQMSR